VTPRYQHSAALSDQLTGC